MIKETMRLKGTPCAVAICIGCLAGVFSTTLHAVEYSADPGSATRCMYALLELYAGSDLGCAGQLSFVSVDVASPPPGPNPMLFDSDGDGLLDLEEAVWGTDSDRADSDADGLDDLVEIQIATDPLDPDTDGDGLRDGDEVNSLYSDPKNPQSPSAGGLEIDLGAGEQTGDQTLPAD